MGGRGSSAPKGAPNTVPRNMIIGPMAKEPNVKQSVDPGHSSVDYDEAFGGAHMFLSASSDARLVNPNYAEGGREWRRNCQRCVFAYEMRRRGYDVEALPRKFDDNETLPYMYDAKGWPRVMKGAELLEFGSRNVKSKMEAQMSEWGDGARAVVRVKWKSGNSGHVFIAEQISGHTVFIDPQTGVYNFQVDNYLSRAVKKDTRLMRVDNLEPSGLILDCAKKASRNEEEQKLLPEQ